MITQIGWEQLKPALTVKELYHSSCREVPEGQGVYFVSAPPELTVIFHSQFWTPPKGTKATPYPVKELEEKYAAQDRQRLLYIGKAAGQRGLHQRLRQYILHGYGEVGNHQGGRAIWQIQDCEKLLISWMVCPDPEQLEHQLLQSFQCRWGRYPVANWKS